MGWTDERIDLVKKLWLDGLSASEIAKQLGGVTRNAVIGKVHRLGLAGRAAPSQPARPAYKKPKPPRPIQEAKKPVLPAKAEPEEVAQPEPLELVYEAPGTARSLTLGPHMCKWPIGDPHDDSFTFCGRRADKSYCISHERVAYQPPKVRGRKRSTGDDLVRSVARYL